jgi:hypothetical protein
VPNLVAANADIGAPCGSTGTDVLACVLVPAGLLAGLVVRLVAMSG